MRYSTSIRFPILVASACIAIGSPALADANSIEALNKQEADLLAEVEKVREERKKLAEENLKKAQAEYAQAFGIDQGEQSPISTTRSSNETSLEKQVTVAATEAAKAAVVALNAEEEQKQKDDKDFWGHFSLGAATLFYNQKHIGSARITGDDRIVIVEESRTHYVTPWLQVNYVWDGLCSSGKCNGLWRFKNAHPGIFAGVGLGAEKSFLNTFAAGGQLTFARLGNTKQSLNLGVGYYVSTIKRLAEGIVEGQPLPENFTDIQYVTRSTDGLLINLSFGFQ